MLWIAFGVEGLTPRALGLRPLHASALVGGGLLTAFFVRVYGPAVYALLRRLRLAGFEGGLAKLEGLPFWYLCLAVLIGGAAEEILYRGYAIASLESLSGSPWLRRSCRWGSSNLAHADKLGAAL